MGPVMLIAAIISVSVVLFIAGSVLHIAAAIGRGRHRRNTFGATQQ